MTQGFQITKPDRATESQLSPAPCITQPGPLSSLGPQACSPRALKPSYFPVLGDHFVGGPQGTRHWAGLREL